MNLSWCSEPLQVLPPPAGVLVPVAASGGATESARARAAVANALFGNPEAAALAATGNNEGYGLGGGGGGGQGGMAPAALGGVGGGLAGVAPRQNNFKPLPPRNFKCKVRVYAESANCGLTDPPPTLHRESVP